jgi:hypothetical protein
MRIARYESPAAKKILRERRLNRHCNEWGFYPEAGR